jgi:hypothetical protein
MMIEVRAHAPGNYRAALTAAADDAPIAFEPVLNRRPAPASSIIRQWADYLLDWMGVT